MVKFYSNGILISGSDFKYVLVTIVIVKDFISIYVFSGYVDVPSCKVYMTEL